MYYFGSASHVNIYKSYKGYKSFVIWLRNYVHNLNGYKWFENSIWKRISPRAVCYSYYQKAGRSQRLWKYINCNLPIVRIPLLFLFVRKSSWTAIAYSPCAWRAKTHRRRALCSLQLNCFNLTAKFCVTCYQTKARTNNHQFSVQTCPKSAQTWPCMGSVPGMTCGLGEGPMWNPPIHRPGRVWCLLWLPASYSLCFPPSLLCSGGRVLDVLLHLHTCMCHWQCFFFEELTSPVR